MFDNYSSSIGGPSSGGSSLGSGAAAGGDAKIDQKVMMAAQQLKLQMEISERCRKVNSMCWDVCDITPKDRLDGKQETCMTYCTERYMDAENYIRNRLMQKAQETMGRGGSSFS